MSVHISKRTKIFLKIYHIVENTLVGIYLLYFVEIQSKI